MYKVLELFSLPDDATDSEKLLYEWFKWWFIHDEAPAKMPEALHIRTGMYFSKKNS